MRIRATSRRLVLAGTAASMSALLVAAPTMAAPFATQASARTLLLDVLSSTITVDTGAEVAQNDGSQGEVVVSEEPLITILDGQDVIEAGALGEVAMANDDGTSGACAGIVGEGGAIEVGDPTACLTPGDTPVTINLVDVLGLVSARIEADAIAATCVGNADGTVTGGINLVGAQLIVSQPLLPDTVVNLSTDVAPNTNVLSLLSPALAALLSPLIDITLNEQVPLDPAEESDGYYGGLQVTALSVDALGDALADIELATVTCGPSADLAIIPTVPAEGIPVALGTLALVGAGGYYALRRRSQEEAA